MKLTVKNLFKKTGVIPPPWEIKNLFKTVTGQIARPKPSSKQQQQQKPRRK